MDLDEQGGPTAATLGTGGGGGGESGSRRYRHQFDKYRRKLIEQKNELRAKEIKENIVEERAALLESSLNGALDSLKHQKQLVADKEATIVKLEKLLALKDSKIEQLTQSLEQMNQREAELLESVDQV